MDYHTPTPEWLHKILRPMFDEQFPDGEEYDEAFDATEVVLGVVDEDLGNERFKDQADRPLYSRTQWFGRAGWRSRKDYRYNPVESLVDELAADGVAWPPLKAGLFGGSVERARAASISIRKTSTSIGVTPGSGERTKFGWGCAIRQRR
jgi:hypothetical protein